MSSAGELLPAAWNRGTISPLHRATVESCPAWVSEVCVVPSSLSKTPGKVNSLRFCPDQTFLGVGVQVSGHHCVLPQAAIAQVLPDAQMGGVRAGVLRRACRAGRVSPASDGTTSAAMRAWPWPNRGNPVHATAESISGRSRSNLSRTHARWPLEIRAMIKMVVMYLQGRSPQARRVCGCGDSGVWRVQGDPTEWVSSHRYHHLHTDTPLDPHSPYEGFWWSHMGWLLDEKV